MIERLTASLEAAEKEAAEANEAAIKAEAAMEEAVSSARDAHKAAKEEAEALFNELKAAKAQLETSAKVCVSILEGWCCPDSPLLAGISDFPAGETTQGVRG